MSQGVTSILVRFNITNTHNVYTYDVGFLPCYGKVHLDDKIACQIKAKSPEKNQGREVKSGKVLTENRTTV